MKMLAPFFSTYIMLSCIFMISVCVADQNSAGNAPASVGISQKEIMKISERGFDPATMELTKEDASVFFVNTTNDSLLTLEIDFGEKQAHCASSNMKMAGNGVLRSSKAIGPQDFAISCFPEKGSYPVVAFGVAGSSKPNKATIIVK